LSQSSNQKPTNGRRASLLRVLIPSWRFFDRLEQVPKLHYRVRREGEVATDWKMFCLEDERTALSLFLNPTGNLNLAFHGLIERAVSDINSSADLQAFSASISYQLVERMVRYLLLTDKLAAPSDYFQFKISILTVQSAQSMDTIDDMLISSEQRLESAELLDV
jgi:hypothetical protein